MKEIILSNGMKTQVDDEDYEYLNQWKWSYDGRYITRRIIGTNEKVYMHHELAKRKGLVITHEIDHENQNKLDNQKDNLRLATRSQNSINKNIQNNSTSEYKGVSFHMAAQQYRARIKIRGKEKHLGLFGTPEEAARAYDKAAKFYFKEFAVLNFPEEI